MGARTEIPKKKSFFFLKIGKIFSEIIPHSGMSRYLYIQVPYFGSSDVSAQSASLEVAYSASLKAVRDCLGMTELKVKRALADS